MNIPPSLNPIRCLLTAPLQGAILSCLLALPATAADVAYYGIFKYESFVQDNTNATVRPDTLSSPFSFTATIQHLGGFTGQVSNASLKLPDDSIAALVSPKSKFDNAWTEWSSSAVSLEVLAAAFPTGNYTLSFDTLHDGSKSLSWTLPPDGFPTTAPRVSNYQQLQWIDTSKPLTIEWDTFAGGTSGSFVYLRLANSFRTASYPGEPGYVNVAVLDTSITIPAGTLPEDTLLAGLLTFEHDAVVDASSYPGAYGSVGFGKETSFNIRTLPRLLLDPVSLSVTNLAGNVVLRWPANLGWVQVEKRDSLTSGSWQNLHSPTNSRSMADAMAGANASYRLRFLAPTITMQPFLEYVAGVTPYLRVTATGTQPMLYQWRKDGVDIPGAIYQPLYLGSTSSNDSGSYSVFITNRAGFALSTALPVTFTNPPPPVGIYMGTFASQTNSGGFAILIRPGGTTTVVGYDTVQAEGLFESSFYVDTFGSFSTTTIQEGSVNGSVDAAGVMGSFTNSTGGSGEFSGDRKQDAGIHQSQAGYYTGTYDGQTSGTAYAILAADGTLFFYTVDDPANPTPDGDGGGFGTINAANTLSATTVPNGLSVSGTLNPATKEITGIYSSGGDTLGTFTLTWEDPN
jgi:hypothetical protein